MARLPEVLGEVLRTAAVAGLDFDVSVVALATGKADLETIDALDHARRAGLVEEVDSDRYRFTHALVRSALRAQLSRTRRVRVHLDVASAIEVIHRHHLDEYAGALAYHFSEAVTAGAGDKAFHYCLRFAERAARLLSHEEAAEAYGRALDLLDRAEGDHPARHELLLAQAEAHRRAGNFAEALGILRSAADEAGATGAGEDEARAAISFEETSFWLGNSGTDALALLARAEKALPAGMTAMRAVTVAATSRALQFSGRRLESVARGDEALLLAEQMDDPTTTVRVLARTNMPYQYVADAPVAAARWADVRARAREIGDDLTLNHALGMSVWPAAQLADAVSFDQLFSEFESLTVKLRLGGWDYFLDQLRSLRAVLAGDLAGAERFLERAHDTGLALGMARDGLYGLAMFLIRREQGRLGEVLPAVRQLAAFSPGLVWRPGRAALYAELGMLAEAREELDALAAARFTDLPTDGSREMCVGLLSEVCAAVGDAERAPLLLEELSGCEGRFMVFVGTSMCLGPADRLLALLASTAGCGADAGRWYERAVEQSRRLHSPLWTARCLCDYARHLSAGDPSRAQEILAEAAVISAEHNLPAVGRLVERLRP